jgi:hypothetical protein
MAKISNTNTYPTKASPSGGDLVIGTDVSGDNATKTFTLQSIANLYSGSGSGTVTSIGLDGGTTGITITSDTTSPITTTGTFTLGGTLATANGGTGLTTLGTAGQILKVNSGATAFEFGNPTILLQDSGGAVVSGIDTLNFNNNVSVVTAPGSSTAIINASASTLWTDDGSGNISYNGGIVSTTQQFEGDINGAILQKAFNNTAGVLSKGQVVYLPGGNNGDNPYIELAQANSASTMSAIGIIKEDIDPSTLGEVITSGELTGLNLTGFTTGDELYVSDVAAGSFKNAAPRTEANLIQKIGKVIKGGNGGALTVLGAFRSNQVPNLNEGSMFLGSSNNDTTTLSIGADHSVLKSDGTTASWGDPFSITTTGTSGAATFSAGTLNIPNYATGGSAIDTGFTPLSIYSSTGFSATAQTLLVQSVCDVDVSINSVDIFRASATVGTPVITIAVYSGTITNPGAATLLQSKTSGTLVAGINTITFDESINLTAGQKIVIYTSTNTTTRIIGITDGHSEANLAVSKAGYNASPGTLIDSLSDTSASNNRVAMHFYST